MDRVSKMKFSTEMTELKTNHAKSIEEIIKLKTTLHRFKTYTSLAALAIVFSSVIFLKYDNSKYTDIMMEKEFLELKCSIEKCNICEKNFGFKPHPVVFGNINSKIMQIQKLALKLDKHSDYVI